MDTQNQYIDKVVDVPVVMQKLIPTLNVVCGTHSLFKQASRACDDDGVSAHSS